MKPQCCWGLVDYMRDSDVLASSGAYLILICVSNSTTKSFERPGQKRKRSEGETDSVMPPISCQSMWDEFKLNFTPEGRITPI